MMSWLRPQCKVTQNTQERFVLLDVLVILHSEAEEETGSAEEQPVSNRLLHYTEAVLGTVISYGCAFFLFQVMLHG